MAMQKKIAVRSGLTLLCRICICMSALMLRVYGKITKIHHVGHAYANHIVVSMSSATGRAYTMLHQTDWCYGKTYDRGV